MLYIRIIYVKSLINVQTFVQTAKMEILSHRIISKVPPTLHIENILRCRTIQIHLTVNSHIICPVILTIHNKRHNMTRGNITQLTIITLTTK